MEKNKRQKNETNQDFFLDLWTPKQHHPKARWLGGAGGPGGSAAGTPGRGGGSGMLGAAWDRFQQQRAVMALRTSHRGSRRKRPAPPMSPPNSCFGWGKNLDYWQDGQLRSGIRSKIGRALWSKPLIARSVEPRHGFGRQCLRVTLRALEKAQSDLYSNCRNESPKEFWVNCTQFPEWLSTLEQELFRNLLGHHVQKWVSRFGLLLWLGLSDILCHLQMQGQWWNPPLLDITLEVTQNVLSKVLKEGAGIKLKELLDARVKARQNRAGFGLSKNVMDHFDDLGHDEIGGL